MGKRSKNPFPSQRWLLIFAFLLAVIVSELNEARFLHSKKKKIHKFFDGDDDFDPFENLEDEVQTRESPLSSTPDHHTSTDSLLTPLLVTEFRKDDDVISSSNDDATFESLRNSSFDLLDGKNFTKDLCAGIRCRVGRVCEVDDEFSGAWCVCAGTGHCVDHGRRVCGSDGHFYFSHCEMHRIACVKNRRIRANHDEKSCVRRLLTKGVQNYKTYRDSTTEQLTENSSLEFTDAPNPTTRVPLSTDRTAADKEQSALLSAPKQTSKTDCSAEDYEKLLEKLLEYYCLRAGNHNCKETNNRNKNAAKSMFTYYDRNSDGLLDQSEMDAMEVDLEEHEDHDQEELQDSCLLRDVMKFYDKNEDMALDLAELCVLLRIPSSHGLEQTLKTFPVSATIGTSLELKCDSADQADYTWRRNGDHLTDLTDNKVKVFDDGSLYISEVFIYHMGNYSCQEKNSDEIICTHLVTVHVPPIVRVSPKIRFLVPRSTVTVNCYAEGIPVPNVSWAANDIPLPDKPDHYTLLHNGLSLQIRDVDYSVDTGTFKCQASSFVGLSEDVATIFIENDGSFQGTYGDELYELFIVFHSEGYTVYEPGHCHMHHVVKGDYRIKPKDGDDDDDVATLCGSNGTCEWGVAVNVKNTFVYASQPKLNRIIVIELRDRFNPSEIIAVDENPMEIFYVKHLDQVWVSCATNTELVDDVHTSKTLLIIQRASADVHHSVIHTQPVIYQYDRVRSVFLPPENAFRQTFDYGFVIRSGQPSLHKIDMNTMTYVKELDLKSKSDCIVTRMTFVPLAGKIFVRCKLASDRTNMTSSCFTIDYVTDKISDTTIACGDSFVSPDSRHLVVVADNQMAMRVYRIEDDGSMELVFDKEIDLRIGELTFTVSERGYDLFANSADKSSILYMNLASGYMEIIKGGHAEHSSGAKFEDRQPIVSGGIFSDYVLTTSTDTIRVIDIKRRHFQCEWQGIKKPHVVAWVEAADR